MLFFATIIIGALAYLAQSVPVVRNACPNGWMTFEESCYIFHDRVYIDWDAAMDKCGNDDATLVVIESQAEDEMLIGQAQKLFKPCAAGFPGASFWLGATDRQAEGEWTWFTNRQPLSSGYSHWAPGEPDNSGNQDCALLYGPYHFLWGSNACDMRANVICERNGTIIHRKEIIG